MQNDRYIAAATAVLILSVVIVLYWWLLVSIPKNLEQQLTPGTQVRITTTTNGLVGELVWPDESLRVEVKISNGSYYVDPPPHVWHGMYRYHPKRQPDLKIFQQIIELKAGVLAVCCK